MKRIIVVCWLSIFLSAWGQEKISRVHFFPRHFDQLSLLQEQGFTPEHLIPGKGGGWVAIMESRDLQLLAQLFIPYQIEIEDVEAHYANMLERQEPLLDSRSFCGLSHFKPGSMGGYHTYTEVLAQLDSMYKLFPTLISEKFSIGQSVEGRNIFAVKISDHADRDESSTEAVVYLDALTHAREPLSMEVNLYYMWWLLENYGQIDLATYLVNNREIYIVPVVNPDGYVYNQQIQPGGGGMWRKNRRPNNNGCYGIDLNRNFSLGWGTITGSTNDPCSNTYRGSVAFSEPETRAVRMLLDSITPAIAFSNHSFGNKLLNPLGYVDSVVNYEVYAELASEFIPPQYYGYGTVKEMLNYNSAGTTRDYFHAKDIIGWTAEIGNEFWEPASMICTRVQEFLRPLIFISRVAGDYVKLQGYHQEETLPGDSVALFFRVKNKGLSRGAQKVRIEINSLTPKLTVAHHDQELGQVIARSFASNDQLLHKAHISSEADIGEELPLEVVLTQDGIESDRDTVMIIAGVRSTRFADDFENGRQNWTQPLGLTPWDTTFIDQWNGNICMTDSRYGNYSFNHSSTIQIDKRIDLQKSYHPILSFSAKWSLEPGRDWVQLEIQSSDQNNWIPLEGKYSHNIQGQPIWTGHQSWSQESINLSAYKGKTVRIRFTLTSNELVHSDGFYFDDFEIIDFRPNHATAIDPSNELDQFVEISPNPATDFLNIIIDYPNSTVFTFTLQDLSGKTVLKPIERFLTVGKHQISLNTGHIPAGIYLLHIFSEAGSSWKKVILK